MTPEKSYLFSNILKDTINCDIDTFMHKQYKKDWELSSISKEIEGYLLFKTDIIKNAAHYNQLVKEAVDKNTSENIRKMNTLLVEVERDIKNLYNIFFSDNLHVSDHLIVEKDKIETLLDRTDLTFDLSKFESVSRKIEESNILNTQKLTDAVSLLVNHIKDNMIALDGSLLHLKKIDIEAINKAFPLEELDNLITCLHDEVYSSYGYIQDNSDLTYSDASQYSNVGKSKKGLVKTFMSEKVLKEKIYSKITLDNHPSYALLTIFDDKSVIATDKKGNHTVLFDQNELKSIVRKEIDNEMAVLLNKKPYILKAYKKALEFSNYNNFREAFRSIENFLQNEDILKSRDFDLIKVLDITHNNHNNIITDFYHIEQSLIFIPKRYYSFEGLDDDIASNIIEHRFTKFCNSILSNKYRFLLDEQNETLLRQIYDAKTSETELQEYIGRKIAAYKTPEDFNTALVSFFNLKNSFDKESVIAKAEALGAGIVYDEDNRVILRINYYDQSKELGSNSWCIVRDEYYFQSYVDDNRQFFCYDFNKPTSDNTSLIGITLDEDNNVYAAHLKNDAQMLSDAPELTLLLSKILDKPKIEDKIDNNFSFDF